MGRCIRCVTFTAGSFQQRNGAPLRANSYCTEIAVAMVSCGLYNARMNKKKIDEDALAEAYNRALELEKAGDIDAAVEAYQEVLAIDPDDHGGAAVRIASMGRGETPVRAP